jgi:hypothetical protein
VPVYISRRKIMNFVKHATARVTVGALAVAAVAAVAPVGAQAATAFGAGAAAAATTPVSDSISISPDPTVTVGSQVTITASATNNTSSTISGALGIENPQYASEKITGVSGSCNSRNLQKLIYCGDTQWAPGATIKIVVTITATAAGTDNFTVYSYGGGNPVYASESLTVS